jgi:hypothetical protein
MMMGFGQESFGENAQSARSIDNTLTAEQGRHMEALSIAVIEHLGFKVVDSQISLPSDYPVTGHPDGRLEGDSLDMIWGFEHKHLGRYSYEQVLKKGLAVAEPHFILQSGLYGDALGWDAAQFVIMAQDSASVRGDMTANLRAKNPEVRWSVYPGIDPKVTIAPIDLRPVKHGLVPAGLERAKWLTNWKLRSGDPADIHREADPETLENKWVADGQGGRMEVQRPTFPCSYCPYLAACLEAGNGGEYAPALPWIIPQGDTGD